MRPRHVSRFRRRVGVLLASSALLLSGAVVLSGPALGASATAECAPAWQSGTAYPGGSVVSFDGSNYSAKWWTQGEQPSASNQWGAWKLEGACGGDGTGTGDDDTNDDCPAPWDSGAVYTGGDLVLFDGAIYSAKWWTQGDQPSTSQVWQFVETCDSDNPGDDNPGGDDDDNPGGDDDNPVIEAPAAPTGLAATKVTAAGVTLTWQAVDGAETYTVYQGPAVAADGLKSTSANIAGLEADTDYVFTVAAVNKGGASPQSLALTIHTEEADDDGTTPGDGEACRPDGLYQTPGVDVPYCTVYDTDGREILPNDLERRVIGYFTSWRDGVNGAPQYLASDIPWDKISHINYAFAHIGANGKVSVNEDAPGNAATDETWPGNPAASMDPSLPFDGHFNLLEKYKKANPGVKTLISVGGWAETGGYLAADGTRVADGGFYTMTASQAKIDAFADSAVAFIREYGFDGVDIDYEYATSNSKAGNPDDFWVADANRGTLFKNFDALMKSLRTKLDQAAAQDGHYYMLTVAAPASGWLLRGMETYQMTQYLDYVNIMSYDLHGAWNNYVGGLAPLFDDGKDAELAAGGVYGAYSGMGYLNTDWAYHYFRGALQAGRINIGVPFYTRGWEGITGGTNGMGGKAALPDQTKCPPGTGSNIGSTTPCGAGGVGIENVWHDVDPVTGAEVPSGVNPIWHALNLQNGIAGSYLDAYGVTEKTITGTYSHFFDSVTKNEWWYNSAKKSLITGDSDAAITAKADYVADNGIGGVMIWELAGDYAWDASAGEYGMGDTLVTILHDKLSSTTPYGASKANVAMPTEAIPLEVTFDDFALGDNNYPINPKVTFHNNSSVAIPAGSIIEFDYSTSNPDMGEQNGWGLAKVRDDHTGSNVGGIKGDFHTVTLKVPSGGIAAGGSQWTKLSWKLPMTSISNLRITIDGKTYAATYDHPRGVTVVDPGTGTNPGGDNPGGDNPGNDDPGVCTGDAWDSGKAYNGGAKVYKDGKYYTARYWTQGNDPATSGEWGPWAPAGNC